MGMLSATRVKALLAALAAYKVYKKVFPKRVKTVNGKRFLVTGAASGVGRLLVVELLRQGASVVAWDVQGELLEETKVLALASYPRADIVTMVCNLADPEDIRANCAKLLDPSEPEIDAVINNAGVIVSCLFVCSFV
jgi:NAD(P)-dependent dehydrogenase (short-subunit alcohol dehydrogenase family)